MMEQQALCHEKGALSDPLRDDRSAYHRQVVGIRPVVLLVPSMAAAVELPRRLASTGRAVAGLYPFKVMDLARAIAEPALLGRGLLAWGAGHDALLAARLLEESAGPRGLRLAPELPRAPVAAALARTFSALRRAGIEPHRLDALAERSAATAEDGDRLRAVATLFRGFHDAIEGRFADPATVLRAAREHLGEARWLRGAEVLVAEDLELDGVQAAFVEALARALPVRLLRRERPTGLGAGSFAAWAAANGVGTAAIGETVLAPLAPPAPPPGLARLRARLFDPPAEGPAHDASLELMTGPGEAAEVRGIVRRLLRAAADGVPFEDMGVILPRPDPYAPLFTDLFLRLGIPHRLHPSLPLRTGRTARSLLLLVRCRGLARTAVLEFLTFAPVPFEELLAAGETPRTAQWDAISRDAGIVSGMDRWTIGLRAYAAAEREGAAAEPEPERRARRERRASDALTLLGLVETLAETLDALAGEAAWPAWADRLQAALDRWIGTGLDRQAVADVIADLRGLAFLEREAPWRDVEAVLEARFEWERVPLDPLATGAIHVGAMDAMAGLSFRVVAIPGLVEGGYPGVVRPDPFLLDPEREALAEGGMPPATTRPDRPAAKGQLSLFDQEPEAAPAPAAPAARLPTTQDRLLEARRDFHRAVSQATERLILSYPRADPRTGRERMPSLFFVAAASAREGKPVGAADLERIVVEDDLDSLPIEDAVDRSERDRRRVRAGGREAVLAVARGSSFFRQSHLASRARWSKQLTAYDGLIAFSPRDGVSAEAAAEVRRKLDPVTADRPMSASRLAAFSRCGFLYLLQYVLRLEPAREPEERKRLDPLERGSAFHDVAERFLRERRDTGELPVRDTPVTRQRLLEVADEALDALVAGSPPRYTVLWERERARFHAGVLKWLEREAAAAGDAVPAYFEVGFGMSRAAATGEPHRREPLEIDLGAGRTLRVSGQIDRIDQRPDGTLVLRDYKTGKAPRDENGLFRGAKQLQIPFYILAAAELFPGHPVVEAFLDYVDGGRQVALDPASVQGEEFGQLLRGLVEAIADGLFVQEYTACTWCEYTAACGPAPLLERRRQYKIGDPRIQRVLRLREIG
jgi:RecB family exonuclease